MKRRVVGLLLLTALLLGASTIAAACGGGDEELSLEEYFQKLQTSSDDLEQRGEASASELGDDFDPETGELPSIDTLQRILSEGVSAFQDALNEVESLDPPSEVKGAHDTFLQEARARMEVFESLADRAAEAESLSDLEDVFAEFEGPDFEAADIRFEDACRGLEQVAAENGIEVDLNCE